MSCFACCVCPSEPVPIPQPFPEITGPGASFVCSSDGRVMFGVTPTSSPESVRRDVMRLEEADAQSERGVWPAAVPPTIRR
ncbi:MAG: hypothetical protein OXF02_01170 [Simkaniaceae bacterium]|nr:hypothetical protein [Simkaniaceae bacterium]